MPSRRTLFMVGGIGAAAIAGLLLSAVVTTHLMANREMVKSFIVQKTVQATGSRLDYERLDVSFFPLPHLKASGIQLHRPEAFELQAQALSIYPRLLAILTGRVSIRRLVLETPDTRVSLGTDPLKAPAAVKRKGDRRVDDAIRSTIGGLFSALTAIDPGTDLRIDDGSLTLAFSDAPDLQIDGIDAYAINENGDQRLNLACRSGLTGNLELTVEANDDSGQVNGRIKIADINLRRLLEDTPLPGDVTIADTHTTVEATVTVSNPETVHSRFNLQFPSLTVMRKGHQLDLETVVIAATLGYTDKQKVLSFDSLQSAQPPLNLSATAAITPAGENGRSILEINAAAKQLDVAVAAQVTHAIAGDLKAIRTAFSYAKQGMLTDVTYHAAFDVDPTGWQPNKMKASGHIAQGLVSIPAIEADLERMNGDIAFEDKSVVFKGVSGQFKGATFERLEAAIDWEKASTLTVACPSVAADVAPLYTWLTNFKGLERSKKYIETATGKATLSKLEINGPLTRPSKWAFNISGTPQALRLKRPLLSHEYLLSGGEVVYIPGKERVSGVKVEFLDGSFVVSGQTKGIVDPESASLHIDGSMGQATLDWLGTILPIPEHLQIKPPIDLSDVSMEWDNLRKTVSFKGQGKSAGGVALFTDFTRTPDAWQIRKFQFSDGHSKATGSGKIQDDSIELNFTGNVDSQTADRLLRDNRTLSGQLEGDFQGKIDTATPLNSTFSGKLSGSGLHLRSIVRDPIEVKQFALEGHDNQFTIAPSTLSLLDSLVVVDGVLSRSDGSLVFDLNVNADRLDEKLIRALRPAAEDSAEPSANREASDDLIARGDIHLNVTNFTYSRFTWSPVEADIRIEDNRTHININKADLCGISTTGEIEFSPSGLAFSINPSARDASLQQTDQCLWHMPVKAEATYDLSGELKLPPTRENPLQFMSGQLDFLSQNGKIMYANVTSKVISFLERNDAFAKGESDVAKEGLVYTIARSKAHFAGGKLIFDEILVDGKALKLTGQGSLDLQDTTADIILLAAPLRSADRVVNNLPVINFIIGGSLVSIPIRIQGKWTDLQVVAMHPADVGQRVLNNMERMLKAPSKLVQAPPGEPETDSKQNSP